MDFTLLGLLLFVLLFLALFTLLAYLFRGRVRLSSRVQEAEEALELNWGLLQRRAEEFLKPIGQAIPRPPDDLSREQHRLVQAGFRGRDAVYVLYGARVILILGFLALFIVTGLFWSYYFLIWTLVAIFLGVVLPDLWVRWRIASRKQRIEWALPDFMDLAVVCVESGLGLDQTIQRVGREIGLPHPDLGEELRLYSLESHAGRTRPEALRNLAQRTGVEELRSFAAVLIQADRFGTSVAQTLRIFAEDLRIKRRQKAEEAAAKLPIKLIFPITFFVFPAFLVVALGPAAIAIYRDLFGALGAN